MSSLRLAVLLSPSLFCCCVVVFSLRETTVVFCAKSNFLKLFFGLFFETSNNHPKKEGNQNRIQKSTNKHFKFTRISDSLLLITYNEEEEDKEDKEEDGEDEKKKRIIIE